MRLPVILALGGAAVLATGTFLAGDRSVARVASPQSAGASGPSQQAAVGRRVTLQLDNMYCASCPGIVKQNPATVPGVKDVSVSFRNQTAIVTFDDTQTNMAALTDATFEMGYPSEVKTQ